MQIPCQLFLTHRSNLIKLLGTKEFLFIEKNYYHSKRITKVIWHYADNISVGISNQ